MSLREPILCFKHCGLTSIFCKRIPNNCPICDSLLNTFSLEPFVIPYPLTNAKEQPYCMVIRPSKGNFLDDYDVTDDLHIGVTDCNGSVVEYDSNGLIKNNYSKWRDCAVIQCIPASWEEFWDETLLKISNDLNWNSNNYNEKSLNCFDFVISFLKNLKYSEILFTNKEDLCKVFILPKLQNILKYAVLHKQLKKKDFFFQE